MQKYGVDGHARGRDIIEKELQSHFGSARGAGLVGGNTSARPSKKIQLVLLVLEILPEGIFYQSSGVIHPFPRVWCYSKS
jgi:hypothetical protein